MTTQPLTVHYCSQPDGHAPKDCPDLRRDANTDASDRLDNHLTTICADLPPRFTREDEERAQQAGHDSWPRRKPEQCRENATHYASIIYPHNQRRARRAYLAGIDDARRDEKTARFCEWLTNPTDDEVFRF